MEDVSLDNAVHKLTADESEFPVDCRSGATDVVPRFGLVVGQRWVGMLQEGDGDYETVSARSYGPILRDWAAYQASG